MSDKKSFLRKVFEGKAGNIYLLQGIDEKTKRKAYYFILVAPSKEPALSKLKFLESMDVSRYGTIIESGYGHEPSKELQEEIVAKYGS